MSGFVEKIRDGFFALVERALKWECGHQGGGGWCTFIKACDKLGVAKEEQRPAAPARSRCFVVH